MVKQNKDMLNGVLCTLGGSMGMIIGVNLLFGVLLTQNTSPNNNDVQKDIQKAGNAMDGAIVKSIKTYYATDPCTARNRNVFAFVLGGGLGLFGFATRGREK